MTTTAVGRTYSIGEVSERTGISTHTLRLKLRSTGMPLPEIRRYAELVREGSGTVKERFRLLREHEARVRRQLADLQDVLSTIEVKVAYYADRLDEGAADELWVPGPGPGSVAASEVHGTDG